MSRTPVTLRNTLAAFFVLGSMLALLMAWGAPAQAALTYPSSGESFGPEGTGVESFPSEAVIGVATRQSTGDIFVYEGGIFGNSRVYKFDANGNPVDFSGIGLNYIKGTNGVSPAFGSEGEIAVDDSSGPDAGDIYVANNNEVKIYAASGVFLGELTGGELCGVAVDPSGAVYVGDYASLSVRKYTPAVNPVTDFDETASMGGLDEPCNVAADGAGNVYVAAYSGGVQRYESSQFGSSSATGTLVDASGRTMTVDPETGDLFVDEGSQVTEFDAAGNQLGASGAGTLNESFGVALGAGASGKLYAGDATRVDMLGPAVALPEESVYVPSISGSTLLLRGSVNPGGDAVTSCQFEYGTSVGVLLSTVACSPDPGSASEPVEVSGTLGGLTQETTYFYRLTVANAYGSTHTVERSFFDPGPPSATDASFSNVGSSSATLSAKVDPGGSSTSYFFEYGTSTSYGSVTATESAGAGTEAAGVQVTVEGLQAGVLYHFRAAAVNAGGEISHSDDATFTTYPPSATGLPDGRFYEAVTPEQPGDMQVMVPHPDIDSANDFYLTSATIRAAADGSGLVFITKTSPEGGHSATDTGNQYLARRTASGWVDTLIQPLTGESGGEYEYFTPDLSAGVLHERAALTPNALGANYETLYKRNLSSGEYEPFSTVHPPHRLASEFGTYDLNSVDAFEGSLIFAGASSDLSHELFEANDSLTPLAEEDPPTAAQNDLYDSVGGQPYLVNVLPDGRPAPGATFGGQGSYNGSSESGLPVLDDKNAISIDGSRVFWTDLNDHVLYMRVNDTQPQSPLDGEGHCTVPSDACTIEVDATQGPGLSGGGRFLSATADGSRVFFTDCHQLTAEHSAEPGGCGDGDLYEYEVGSGKLTDLTVDANSSDAHGANVQGLVGTSEDGSYVYFVATGVLASGGVGGQDNLYALHVGEAPTFVTALIAEDNENRGYGFSTAGDWQSEVGSVTAQVTSDGRHLLFEKKIAPQYLAPREMYMYDFGSAGPFCISCNPTGPTTGPSVGYPLSGSATYALRVMSNDGDRAFFDTKEALVPQDTNNQWDVYEWERSGSGSCTLAAGCIYLLSSGTGTATADFLDASENGDDVFIDTRSQLGEQPQGEELHIVDVRIGTPSAGVQCTGSGCQGTPAAPPIFATPSSVTFNGVGNFAPPTPAVTKPTTKPKPKSTKCKKGFVKKRSKCVKQRKKTKRKQGKQVGAHKTTRADNGKAGRS